MKAVHVHLAAVLLLLSCIGGGALSMNNGTAMKKERDERLLCLRGSVTDVKLSRENNHSIVFDVKLKLEFVNTGDKPVIILQHEFWPGAKSLARSPEDAVAYRYLYISGHWPSVSTAPEWGELRQRLDQPSPPQDLTRVLSPGETLPYETGVILYIEKSGSFDGTSQKWETIKQASALWLKVTLEMWPINIEPRVDPENPEFGKMLQRRWRQYGKLQLARLTSEPMQLDLATLTMSNPAH